MHPKNKNWAFIVVGIVAAAIPLSALFMEPPSETEAASAVQQEPGLLRLADNFGYEWVLKQARGPSPLSFRKPGLPITVKTDVRRAGDALLIGLVLEGRGGETYRPTFTKNKVSVGPAWLQIVDKQGNVLHEARFKYG